jgi:predicted nucleic acid-binding protein
MSDRPQVLLDTSVWVDALRGRTAAVVEAVGDLLREDRVVRCDVVGAELRVGLRDRERSKVLDLFNAVPNVPVDSADWESAGDLGASMRERGVTLPLTDLLVAQVCLRHEFELFSLDAHFQHIEGLKLRRG